MSGVPLGLRFVCNEHGIAKGEEPVAFFNSLMVGIHDVIVPCKGSDQHDKGAFRQMKISDKGIDAFPLVAGIDENIGIIAALAQSFPGNIGGFQRAAAGGTYGNDTVASAFGLIDEISGLLRDPVVF